MLDDEVIEFVKLAAVRGHRASGGRFARSPSPPASCSTRLSHLERLGRCYMDGRRLHHTSHRPLATECLVGSGGARRGPGLAKVNSRKDTPDDDLPFEDWLPKAPDASDEIAVAGGVGLSTGLFGSLQEYDSLLDYVGGLPSSTRWTSRLSPSRERVRRTIGRGMREGAAGGWRLWRKWHRPPPRSATTTRVGTVETLVVRLSHPAIQWPTNASSTSS